MSILRRHHTTIRVYMGLLGAFLLSLLMVTPSLAATYNLHSGVNSAHGDGQPTDLFGDGGIFTTIVNILLYLIGAISVVMLIVGGLRYVISNGNSDAVAGAKNTILYAIVGVVVALLAYAIINFVIGALTPGGAGGSVRPTNV